MLARVILAVDKGSLQKHLSKLLGEMDVLVEIVEGKKHLWEHVVRATADIFILHRSLIPEPAFDKIGLLRELPDLPSVVLISDHEAPKERARFLAAGCDAVLSADLPSKEMGGVLSSVLNKRFESIDEVLDPRQVSSQPKLSDFVSASPAMRAFVKVVRRVVGSDCSLLILGETGVGKEHLAKAIHAESPRSNGPFIAVNCGALPETLLESELFGHEEGAFTGASRSRRGCFELAHKGTIFLDEIGDMPRHLQVKLLRVLQERRIQRLGSEQPVAVNVRIMAASNRDLEAEVEDNNFRRDLYYRLSVVTLKVPSLRERAEDIPSLVESYIDYFRSRIGCEASNIESNALDALEKYAWPGNVRELINVIERAMLLCSGGEIAVDDLPETIGGLQGSRPSLSFSRNSETVPEEWLQRPLSDVRKEVLERFECAYLTSLLNLTGGRIGETARRAGIQPRSLYDKMKQHNLRKENFRTDSQSSRARSVPQQISKGR